MLLKNNYKAFFLVLIYLFSFNVFVSNSFATENSPTCEITNTKINCLNIISSVVMKIKLFNDPYRMKVNFKKKLNINKNKINDSQFVKSVRVTQPTGTNTNLVIEFKRPTIISSVKYYKINNQSINLSMYFTTTSEVNYAIAKHTLFKNEGDIFSLKNDISISTKNVDLPVNKQNFNKIKSKKNHVVFIDPGHGGKDPGAIGQLGSLEKNITLKASILLAKS